MFQIILLHVSKGLGDGKRQSTKSITEYRKLFLEVVLFLTKVFLSILRHLVLCKDLWTQGFALFPVTEPGSDENVWAVLFNEKFFDIFFFFYIVKDDASFLTDDVVEKLNDLLNCFQLLRSSRV